jgi:hypothetical protein
MYHHGAKYNLFRFRGFRLMQLCFNSCLYFFQIIRYMFWSYDHLQAEIYTLEINKTLKSKITICLALTILIVLCVHVCNDVSRNKFL